jgi:hypothetical protein
MPEPVVVTAMREFKQGLLLREAAQMQEMARRWLAVEQALEAQIAALTGDLAAMKAAGETVSRAKLYQLDRYQRLLTQTQAEFRQYAAWAEGEIRRGQAEMARLGLAHSAQAIQLSYWPHVGAYFDRLPLEAVEYMVGLAGNGRPVGELLRLRMVRGADGRPLPEVWERLTETLINGTALGWNPRKTAGKLKNDLTGGLNKAMVIARTEQLRVYREVSREQYAASGVVRSQKRLSAHDGRVCGACLADDGKVYSLGAVIADHPQGRCTSVPLVEDVPETAWTAGEAWFRQQPPAVQQSILGRETYEAWSKGQFEFGALTTHTDHEVWGGGVQVTPLSQLVVE